MRERLQAAKTGLCLRRVAARGKGIEAAAIANHSHLFEGFPDGCDRGGHGTTICQTRGGHRIRNAARPAKGELGSGGGSGLGWLARGRGFSLARRHTGLAPATSIPRQPSAFRTARASSLLEPSSETNLVSTVSASVPA